MSAPGTFRINVDNAWVSVYWPKTGEMFNLSSEIWKQFRALHTCLRKAGWTVGRNERIYRQYRSLTKYHKAGRDGHLEMESEVFPIGCSFQFFQSLVIVNRNGGLYDFNKYRLMPYLVRKRFERAVAHLRQLLVRWGFLELTDVSSPNPDPLAFSNSRWDGDLDRKRCVHRFERDETGWPSANELKCWSQKDRDGIDLRQGDVRYYRDRDGYLKRGRAYGGINGMWFFVYGPGRRDFTQVAAGELIAIDASTVRTRVHPKGRERLQKELQKAVKAQDYKRAAVLAEALGIKPTSAAA